MDWWWAGHLTHTLCKASHCFVISSILSNQLLHCVNLMIRKTPHPHTFPCFVIPSTTSWSAFFHLVSELMFALQPNLIWNSLFCAHQFSALLLVHSSSPISFSSPAKIYLHCPNQPKMKKSNYATCCAVLQSNCKKNPTQNFLHAMPISCPALVQEINLHCWVVGTFS